MTPPVHTDATYGEGYDVGHADGEQLGRARERGDIVAGILRRANEAQAAAGTASTVNQRNASAAVAEWLRELAAEVRRGEL